MDLDRVRQHLPAIQHVRYFNTGGIGPMPRPVWEATTSALDRPLVQAIDPMAWAADLAAEVPALRARVSRFLGADAAEIAFVRSVSEAYGIVLWGLRWQPGDVVLTSSEEHQSGLMPLWNLARRNGGYPEIRTVPIGPDAGTTIERFAAALDGRVRLVALSQVTTDSGTVLPIEQITRLAHAVGTSVLVDGAQAAGQMVIDLHRLGVDYYAGIGSKWLMGPVGTGFLYVRSDLQSQLDVTWTGYTAEAHFDWASASFEFLPDARKFEFGARHWPLYFGLGAALDFLDGIGIGEVVRRSLQGADRLRHALATIPGVRLLGPADPTMHSAILAFSVDGREPRELSAILRNQYRIVQRAAPIVGGVRLSWDASTPTRRSTP